MFTSRAEFRLHLRIDNADRRLTPHGRRAGLISDQAWTEFQQKQERLAGMKKLLESTRLAGEMLQRSSDNDLSSAVGQTLAQVLKRPEIGIEALVSALKKVAAEFFARDDSPANS